jgi:hypothetical protein
LATLAKAYEKSGIFEQARKTLELAWSIPRRLEKTIGDNTEHAEYAIVKMTLGWLYLVNFTVIIQECAAAVVGGSDTTGTQLHSYKRQPVDFLPTSYCFVFQTS